MFIKLWFHNKCISSMNFSSSFSKKYRCYVRKYCIQFWYIWMWDTLIDFPFFWLFSMISFLTPPRSNWKYSVRFYWYIICIPKQSNMRERTNSWRIINNFIFWSNNFVLHTLLALILWPIYEINYLIWTTKNRQELLQLYMHIV